MKGSRFAIRLASMVAWCAIAGALTLAVIEKVFNFDLFKSYIGTVSGLNPWLSVTFAFAIVLLETGILGFSLVPARFGAATFACGILGITFFVFHGIRMSIGDPLPCACFGNALQLSPGQFLWIDGFIAIGSFAVSHVATGGRWIERVSSFPKAVVAAWGCVAIVGVAAEIKMFGPGRRESAPPEFTEIRKDYSALLAGSSHLREMKPGGIPIIIFGDYQCPYTQKLLQSEEYASLVKNPDVAMQWRELPLTRLHPLAQTLAVVSKNAAQENRLLQVQPELVNASSSPARAKSLYKLISSESNKLAALDVREDVQTGLSLGINHTPAILVIFESKLYEARSLNDLSSFVEAKTRRKNKRNST